MFPVSTSTSTSANCVPALGRVQLFGLRVQELSRHLEELSAGIVRGEPNDGRGRVRREAPPRRRPGRETSVADADGHVCGLETQLLGGHHGEGRAETGAEVLGTVKDLDAAVAVDPDLRRETLVSSDHVPVAAGHADPALPGPRCVAGPLVAPLPPDGLRADVELDAPHGARLVLPPQVERIHAELLGHLVDGRLDREGPL
jgi:hypothetical protein